MRRGGGFATGSLRCCACNPAVHQPLGRSAPGLCCRLPPATDFAAIIVVKVVPITDVGCEVYRPTHGLQWEDVV